MNESSLSPFSRRVAEATSAVFGDTSLARNVLAACQRHDVELRNISDGRGINVLMLAIVGTKGQGKTWAARQLVRSESIRQHLRSGDLFDDATTRLVWIGPTPPDSLDVSSEVYFPCPRSEMIDIGQPYVLLDTPGSTDSNSSAAKIASDALSLAPIKILVVSRDQIRSASNLDIAQRIDGSICILVISSVEPDELTPGAAAQQLRDDVRDFRDQLHLRAPRVTLAGEICVPDFEITGNEPASQQVFVSQLLDRLAQQKLDQLSLASSRDARLTSSQKRLRSDVTKLIGEELPHLAAAVERLNHETERLPDRVLGSLLGSEGILETGVRMRLRTKLVSDTLLIWFPYRTVMSLLNLTQGAWDRVVLALAGSVPSLFGALASWARNARQSQEFAIEIQDGIRERTRRQVEDRLKPLCEQFHRAVQRLHPRTSKMIETAPSSSMNLSGIDELQNHSREIFDHAIERHATRGWLVQGLGLLGAGVFWLFFAGPIVSIYRQYIVASFRALTDASVRAVDFPHPTASLLITSAVLSLLPLLIYCMLVLTIMLSRRKVRRVVAEIQADHKRVITTLKENGVIHLEFEDRMLQQAEFLLNLDRTKSSP